MDRLQFVKLAVSKDAGRYNLTGVYRDTDCFVATDGHRLHRKPAPKLEGKPHFIDGNQCDFVQYESVLPKSTMKPVASCSVTITKDLVKTLQSAVKLGQVKDKRQVGTRFTLKGDKFLAVFKSAGLSFEIDIPVSEHSGEIEIGLNLSYVQDALIGAFNDLSSLGKTKGMEVKIDFYGENTIVHIQAPGIGDAIIMPIRLDKI